MQVLVLLVALATGVLGVPVEKTYEFRYDAGRERGTPRLLHEEWRLPDGTVEGTYSYTDPLGKLRSAEYTAGEGGFVPRGDIGVNVPSDVDQTVEQAAESQQRPQTIRDFDLGRSLGRPSSPSRRPQQPFYRGAEYLAEKPALPPHVLKARSGETVRVRSRSRPVHKPLYTSSDHLAERPAIPLPQLEAYESSRGPLGLTPYVEEVVQKGSPTESSTNAGRSKVTVLPPKFSKPSSQAGATTPVPAAEVVDAEEPVGLVAKPSLFGTEKDSIPQAETGGISYIPDSSKASSTTLYPPEKQEGGSQEDELQPGGVSFYASTFEEGAPSVPLTTGAPQDVPSSTDSVQAETVGASEQSVDPEELYSSDNEISRDHTRHHSVVPTTTPLVQSTSTAEYEKASSSSTPRRRFTFQPFSKSSAVPATSPVPATTTAVPEAALYGGGLQSDGVQERVPGVSPGPNAGLEATKNLLISTEPTVNENNNVPEVPQEPEGEEFAKTEAAAPLTTEAVPKVGDRNDSANGYNPVELSEATPEVEVTEQKGPQHEEPASSGNVVETVQVPQLSEAQEQPDPVRSDQATTLQPATTESAFPTLAELHESFSPPDAAGTVAAVQPDSSFSEIPGEEAASDQDTVPSEKDEGLTSVPNDNGEDPTPSLLLNLGFSSELGAGTTPEGTPMQTEVPATVSTLAQGDAGEAEAADARDPQPGAGGSTVSSTKTETETPSDPSISERLEGVPTGAQGEQPTPPGPATVTDETLQPGHFARGIRATYIGSRSVDF